MTYQQRVREFNICTGATRYPTLQALLADPATTSLRVRLIEEEIGELYDALMASCVALESGADNPTRAMVEIPDALGDIVYVAAGFADVAGMEDLSSVVVHTSKKLNHTPVEFTPCHTVGEFLNAPMPGSTQRGTTQAVDYFYHQIRLSFNYLKGWVAGRKYKNIRPALQCIVSGCVRMCAAMSIDFETVFDRIHKSNMSKMCPDIPCAQRTIDNYIALEHTHPYRGLDMRKVGDVYVVFDNKGKVLKSIDYTPVDLTDLIRV